MLDVWFHPQSSLRAGNAFGAAHGISERSGVGSVYFGGSAGAGVYHENYGNIWI